MMAGHAGVRNLNVVCADEVLRLAPVLEQGELLVWVAHSARACVSRSVYSPMPARGVVNQSCVDSYMHAGLASGPSPEKN